MGMFDSLMVKINDRDIELQTKRFENRLGHYHPGLLCGLLAPPPPIQNAHANHRCVDEKNV
ncbi:MAG TPA: hypothetical protein PLE99_16450 [Candidatus Thiothrix moscowensis]|uniref:hypothetical protein n=1 Tax=unclassified Thiothrix TaxID=2636184 RepID=UPI0025D576CB|nr:MULTISPECIES: hypothetical protein [unclassified Thiothrix]HRJ54352.1 hypothetical protein [Candidatus Thiothrix moscowensis]HRJ94573.1 hypothetical protein [Candidatus Thiothrix moscowensis]